MKKIVLILVLVLLTPTAWAKPELKGAPEELRQFLHPQDNVVSLRGKGLEKAYSDRAVVNLVVTTEEKLLSESMTKNSDIRETIRQRLIQFGVVSDAINNAKFSTLPQYGWFGKKPDRYKVVNRMTVTVSDELQLRELAVIADQMSEVELSSTSFEHSHKQAYTEKVKLSALADVMAQKRYYEQQLGVRLRAINFREGKVAHYATRGAMMLEDVAVTARKVSDGYGSKASADSYVKPTESSFDEVEYSAEVQVDFIITVGSS